MNYETQTNVAPEDFPSLVMEGDGSVEVQSVLGRGGMGVVYKGFQPSFDRFVAVKTLHKQHFATTQHLQRFRREARTTATLDHPNIVKTYTLGMTADDSPFILMEFVEGKTLADVISSQGCLTPEQFGDYFSQILDGLQYAHDRGIVHRDLKPANIMVTTDGALRIMDFGIAKGMTTDGRTTQSVTATGEVLGSPMYMSPEQCRSEEPNQRSDIYAVGCMLFEALEGHPPFTSDAPLELLIKHLNDAPPPMNNAGPKMEALIHSTLAKNAADRPQSCAELKAELMPLVNEPRRASRVRIPAVKLSKRQKPMVMALIAIAVIVSGSLLLNQKAQEERTTPALQGTARITPESQLRDERPGGQLPQGFEALIAGGKKARIRMNEMRMRGTPEAGLKPEFDESLRYLNKALEKASKDPKSQETMRALMELGTTYNDHNDRQKALETYQAALDSVEKNKTPINISDYNNILCSIGTEYECLQQYDKSEAVKLRALKAAEEKLGSDRSNPAILSGTLESLAILYTSWGKFDKAEEYARRSLYNKSRLTDSDYEMLVYPTQVLGWALLEQGKTRQGYELLHKAAAMGKQAATHKRSIGTAIIFADGLHYLGYAYERLGKKDKAKEVWAQQKMIHASVRQGIVPNIENINP